MFDPFCCELQSVKHGNQQGENLTDFQFFFHCNKSENASQVAKIVNDVYGVNTVTVNYTQFWFLQLRTSFSDVKDALHTSTRVDDNVNKINKII